MMRKQTSLVVAVDGGEGDGGGEYDGNGGC